jgi:hypothetical protein
MEDTKMDHKDIRRKDMGWVHVAGFRDQWRILVHAVMKLLVFYNIWKIVSLMNCDCFLRKHFAVWSKLVSQ